MEIWERSTQGEDVICCVSYKHTTEQVTFIAVTSFVIPACHTLLSPRKNGQWRWMKMLCPLHM